MFKLIVMQQKRGVKSIALKCSPVENKVQVIESMSEILWNSFICLYQNEKEFSTYVFFSSILKA